MTTGDVLDGAVEVVGVERSMETEPFGEVERRVVRIEGNERPLGQLGMGQRRFDGLSARGAET